jgi:cAMP-binding proteins - catabolite gene activator and regulatory subunit of cAMP-dependent protein kinases
LIIQEYNTCNAIGFILEGVLSLKKSLPSGESFNFGFLKEGDSFGEGLLYAEESNYLFSITTISEVIILYIPFEQIEKLLNASPHFSRNYIAFISNRLLLFSRKINLLNQKSVKSRLILYLSEQTKTANRLSFKLAHKKTEIAELIGVTRPSVSRELSQMQKDQLILIDRANITILKPEIFY